MGIAAWERERDARGGGLGLARPLVSHREGLSNPPGYAATWPPPADAPPAAPCERVSGR